MSGSKKSDLFFLCILFGLWIFFFSIWGIIFDKDWSTIFLILYLTLLFSILIVINLKVKKIPIKNNKIEEFEKTLKGGLYHFKCQRCTGIFAIKESTYNEFFIPLLVNL